LVAEDVQSKAIAGVPSGDRIAALSVFDVGARGLADS
jgi:hypothetical protein